ncbi:CHAP domain-containing protein [Streptococcus sp. H31]
MKSLGKNKLSYSAVLCSSVALAFFAASAPVSADSHTIQEGDSFFSIASQYGMDMYELAAMNNMTVNSLILPGQQINVTNNITESNAAAFASEGDETAESQPAAEEELPGNTYPIGQCTWGVKELASWAGDWWGNGGDWAASAAEQGYAVGYVPAVGSIVCWTDGGYGHVAYVTEVGDDGHIQVLEANYKDQQWIDNYRGWFDPNDGVTPGTVTYIYPNI